ncbi:hypothetical protein BaRGS_00010493, partial [Batillaria attramentaria]
FDACQSSYLNSPPPTTPPVRPMSYTTFYSKIRRTLQGAWTVFVLLDKTNIILPSRHDGWPLKATDTPEGRDCRYFKREDSPPRLKLLNAADPTHLEKRSGSQRSSLDLEKEMKGSVLGDEEPCRM